MNQENEVRVEVVVDDEKEKDLFKILAGLFIAFFGAWLSWCLFWLSLFLFVVGTFLTGNFWYDDSSMVRELKYKYPGVLGVVSVNRNIWAYTKIVAVDSEGQKRYFLLDSSLFGDYEFTEEVNSQN